MIGQKMGKSNNIFIYFEGNDIENFSKKITGLWINQNNIQLKGKLEAEVTNEELSEICEIYLEKYNDEKNIKYLNLKINENTLHKLKKRNIGDHQGFRHIYLLDIKRLDFGEKILYNSLKTIRENGI
jgi:hypothetical protein